MVQGINFRGGSQFTAARFGELIILWGASLKRSESTEYLREEYWVVWRQDGGKIITALTQGALPPSIRVVTQVYRLRLPLSVLIGVQVLFFRLGHCQILNLSTFSWSWDIEFLQTGQRAGKEECARKSVYICYECPSRRLTCFPNSMKCYERALSNTHARQI